MEALQEVAEVLLEVEAVHFEEVELLLGVAVAMHPEAEAVHLEVEEVHQAEVVVRQAEQEAAAT